MPATNLAVHEYGHTTRNFLLPHGVAKSNSIWADCITALQDADYHPQQHSAQTVRAPNAWSSPGTNIESAAASAQWNNAYLGQPHVHGGVGVGHRAAIGCRFSLHPGQPPYYNWLRIYIGEFS